MFSSIPTNPFGKSSMATPCSSQFGVPSPPAFRTSAFGTSSTHAFGSSSSFGDGPNEFGKKASLGGFGSTPSQTSPLGSTFPQAQPTFGTGAFDSTTLFSASSHPAIGSSSTAGFGPINTPASGSIASPAFGVMPNSAFCPTNSPAGGSTTTFTFGTSSAPAFGTTVAPAFGVQSTFAPLSSSFPAFSAACTPSIRSPTSFVLASTPSFSFGTTQSVSHSTSRAVSMPFGTRSSTFGTQSSKFGTQTAACAFCSPCFRQSSFVGQQQQKQQAGGSWVEKYQPTINHEENCGKRVTVKLQSISAMPIYKDKNQEELRWEDYQLGDRASSLSNKPTTGSKGSFLTNSEPSNFPRINLSPNPTFLPTSQAATRMQPPNASTSGNFTQTQPVCGPAAPVLTSNRFFQTIYSQTQPGYQPAFHTQTSNIFSVPTQTSSAFNLSQTQPVPTQTNPFNLNQAQPGSCKGLSIGPDKTSPFFVPTQTSCAFNLNQTLPASSNGLIVASEQPLSFFSVPTQTPSSFHISQTQPASSIGLIAVPGQTSSIFSVPTQTPSIVNHSQIEPASSTGLQMVGHQLTCLGGTSGNSGLDSLGHLSSYQANVVMQPVSMSNPFGTLPALHQLSLAPVQYGISRMPTELKSAPIRTSPLSAPRHLSRRRIIIPVRKYNPKIDAPKVPFFTDNEERKAPSIVDLLLIPRENPRSLVTGSIKQWPPKPSSDEQTTGKVVDNPTNKNGYLHPPSPTRPTAKVNEHGDDVEALMPKLRHGDYYTEPQIQELAAKERARPGFCRHVKEFVVGRHGYGCIKFYGETDVRRLNIESIVQFNNREVIVYEDGSKKPPVGRGLNKAAEVMLLNVKCIKKGQHYTEGSIVEKYKEMLMKKTEEQGAEFVSFDAVKGLWKFRVQHF